MKIVVIFPTTSEAKYFSREGITVAECGVGLISSAYNTAKIIIENRPDIAIMAGIAGVYPHSNLKIGDTVLVSAEKEADLGFFYPDGFKHITDMSLDMSFESCYFMECPYIKSDMPFSSARSNSMNSAMSHYVTTSDVEIENMEGASFFRVCLGEKVPFLELRSISNVVDPAHDEWDYDTSLKNMTDGLNRLIDYIQEKEL